MTARRAAPKTGRVPAPERPVARLMVDVALAHLDRPFDYLVPEALHEQVRPGSRVRVRFSGRLVDAFVLERVAETEHVGRLAFLERCVGEPVLTPDTAGLFRAVADRWGGNFVDVVRLGVPARHAQAESALTPVATAPAAPTDVRFARYRAGAAFLTAVAAGRSVRAVWTAQPSAADDSARAGWPELLAEAARAALAAERGAIIVVPDARDVARLDVAFRSVLGPGRHVALSAELGPAERYRRWLAVRRGAVRAVIGPRAAAYAPVADLGLLAIWDDGDDLYDEPRAPYPHTRDVLVLRSSLSGAALLIGGYARTAEAQQLVDSGWAREIAADRVAMRASVARISATGDDIERARDPAAAAARLPSLAWRAARDALADGHPVLVQVPRRGYVPSLACVRDRTPARCAVCAGPLATVGPRAGPACRWCGRSAGEWACPVCGGRALRAVVVGAARTAEELGRAFPGVPVRLSGGAQVLDSVDGRAALVIATPGAEPVALGGPPGSAGVAAGGGYGAALLLDGWALLSRPDLRAAEETLRRWMNAAALVRPDGQVVVGADASLAPVQALVRWDPAGAAARELAERTELRFPPAARLAALSGERAAVTELLSLAQLPEGTEVLGTAEIGEAAVRTLVRAPRGQGARLAAALKAAAAARSARKAPEPVKLVLDPYQLG